MVETDLDHPDECLHCAIIRMIMVRLDDEADDMTLDRAINGVADVLSNMILSCGEDDQLTGLRYFLRHMGLDWSAEHAGQILGRRAQ
jgi:hypothetical protein